jgi:hypothetical protein
MRGAAKHIFQWETLMESGCGYGVVGRDEKLAVRLCHTPQERFLRSS